MNKNNITKREVGKIYTEFSNSRAKSYSVPRQFLQKFAEEFATMSSLYMGRHNILECPPFGFRERQLSTVLSPIFHRICDYHLQEAPTYRMWSQLSRNESLMDSHGWTDFLCMYKDYAFLVEIKHSHISYESGKPDKHSVEHLWSTLNRQIKSAKTDSYWYRDKCKGVFRLGLHIMPVYQSTTKENFELDFDMNRLHDMLTNIGNKFKPQPSFLSMWSLHKNLRGPYILDDRHYYYPAVSMAGILTKLID